MLVVTTAATNYPKTFSRTDDVVSVFKYKPPRNIMPKVEFRYQQFDNKAFQTSPMTQYGGCMSPAPTSAAVPGCPINIIDSTTSPTPTLSPNGPTSFYPYFQVGDTSAARYLKIRVEGSGAIGAQGGCRR